MKKERRRNWMIEVGGFSKLLFLGTEEEAEVYRRAKANWEKAVASKRLATRQEVKDSTWHQWGEINIDVDDSHYKWVGMPRRFKKQMREDCS